MAEGYDDRLPALHAPLKAPAVEVSDIPLEERTALEYRHPPPKTQSERVDASAADHHDDKDENPVTLPNGQDAEEDEEDDDGSGWEDDDELSLYEELIDGMGDEGELGQDANAFTIEESQALRKRLRLVGENRFIRDTVEAGLTTAKKLCTAFGVRPPFFLEGRPDEAYFPLLSVCISRELQKRVKLSQWNTLDDAVELLKGARNVVVLTGAGISTSLGIPDFRSKDTGLYARLEHLGLSDPQEVFDIHLFREDPSIFYSVAKDILPSSTRFTPTHAFIRLLQDKGKLLTNFTQNIDNLEEFTGIEKEKLVQCHGSFATATCLECHHQVECKAIYDDLKAGKVARCEECLKRIQLALPGLKRKRSNLEPSHRKPKKKKSKQDFEDSTDDSDFNTNIDTLPGVMKPDITFFGEDLPPLFHSRLIEHDIPLVDLVIVIGTSLKVAPVSEVVGVIPATVPQIYISRESCNHVDFDIDLLGDCDVVVTELCRRAGWELRHEMVKGGGVEVREVEGWKSRFLVKSRRNNGREEGLKMGNEAKEKREEGAIEEGLTGQAEAVPVRDTGTEIKPPPSTPLDG